MNKKQSLSTVASVLLVASGHVLGNGFALNEQSVSGQGLSYAGRSSSALDASTVYGNPAGMSRLDREQISAGFVAIIPVVDIDNYSATGALGPVSGNMNNDITKATPVPFGYYVKPLNDKWHFGFGVYAPFGQGTDYDHDAVVRYLADKTKVTMITFQPTLSYKVTDDLAVGLGVTANYVKATFGSVLPITDGTVEAEGDDWGFGYNFGLLYQLTPQTRVGASYHSKVKFNIKTQTTVKNLFPLLGPANSKIDGTLQQTTPESVDLSITHELNPDWTLYAGATWTRWSRWDAITINNSNSPTPLFDSIGQNLNWHDNWGYSVGASYQLNPQWVLRAGLALDQSPAGNAVENARLPVADRQIASLGAGWKANDNWTVDFAYSYLRQGKFTLNQHDDQGNNYQADYKASAHGLGIQLNYLF